MKFLSIVLLVFLSLIVRGQTFTPIHNFQAVDGFEMVKYFGIPYGPTPTHNGVNPVIGGVAGKPPGALFYNTTDSSMYHYTGTQWVKNSPAGFVGSNNTHSGYVVWDSLLVFHTTPIVAVINGRQYRVDTITHHTLDQGYVGSSRIDVFYIDTLNHIGVLKGSMGGQEPDLNPLSQHFLSRVVIGPEATTPTGITNTRIYFENIEWTGSSDVAGALFDYTVTPYAGAVSTYLPNFTQSEYVKYNAGSVFSLSDISFVKFRIRLEDTLTGFVAIKFQEADTKRTNYVVVQNGTYGLNTKLAGVWQDVNIGMSEFAYSITTADEIYFYLGGAGTIQLDNIQIQSGGGAPTGSDYVVDVNGVPGPHVILKIGNQLRLSADSTNYELIDSLSGTVIAVAPTLLNYLLASDTCTVIDTTGKYLTKVVRIGINPYCMGSGGAPTDTTSLSNRINLKLNLSDTAAMLLPYRNQINTNTANIVTNTANILLKLNISDTAAMLSPYKTSYPRQAISLTTTGSSGAATYSNSTGVLNIPQYSAGGSTLTRQVITSGSSGTVTGGNYIVTIDPASTLAAYTLTLPASPSDMDIVQVDFGGTLTSGLIVTSLVISPNSGQTILDNTPPGMATADNSIYYRYRTANTKWYRLKL